MSQRVSIANKTRDIVPDRSTIIQKRLLHIAFLVVGMYKTLSTL